MNPDFTVKHSDGTRMVIAEKLLDSLRTSDFHLWTWLNSLDDAELANLGVLMFAKYDEQHGHMFVERLGLVCQLLARGSPDGKVSVTEENLSSFCDLLSGFAGMTLCRRRGLLLFDSLPDITASNDRVCCSLTPKGQAIAGDVKGVLRAVLIPN